MFCVDIDREVMIVCVQFVVCSDLRYGGDLMSWWVLEQWDDPAMLISWLLWVPLSICLHELGHGVVAILQGDRTPIERGHITLNPMVHMGPISLLMFVIVGIAWGAMPVNPYRFKWGRLGDICVSAAGPAVNLLLAVLSLTAFSIIISIAPVDMPFWDNLSTFFWVGGLLNVVLLMLNLLPVPPLDGSHILASLFPPVARIYQSEEFERFGIFLLIAVFYFAHELIWDAAVSAANWYLMLLI